VSGSRPHNLRYVCMPAVRVLAHSQGRCTSVCSGNIFPRPPVVLRAVAPNTPPPPGAPSFSRSRSTRFTLRCRAHALRAREERRSLLAFKASTVLIASRAAQVTLRVTLDPIALDALETRPTALAVSAGRTGANT